MENHRIIHVRRYVPSQWILLSLKCFDFRNQLSFHFLLFKFTHFLDYHSEITKDGKYSSTFSLSDYKYLTMPFTTVYFNEPTLQEIFNPCDHTQKWDYISRSKIWKNVLQFSFSKVGIRCSSNVGISFYFISAISLVKPIQEQKLIKTQLGKHDNTLIKHTDTQALGNFLKSGKGLDRETGQQ